jgi:adenine-specific DNA-methyltransferase
VSVKSPVIATERGLVRLALELGAEGLGGPLSQEERQLVDRARQEPATGLERSARVAIRAGGDPLGDDFAIIRTPLVRRAQGAFWTPPEIVAPMLDWALSANPACLVDPGCGSGRFSAAAARREPDLEIVAIDLDPLATLMTRAALSALGARHATVLNADYLTVELPDRNGVTAFVGNPPYVRHHDLSPQTKAWAVTAAKQLKIGVSGLAGLHALFFVATALKARKGDVGSLVTSSEWLDVHYGGVVRHLLTNGLGGRLLDLIDPRAIPFADAMTTALITCFEVGAGPGDMRLRLVETPAELSQVEGGQRVPTRRLVGVHRWSPLFRDATTEAPARSLGTIARVHRGFVTGANDFFLMTRTRARALGLEGWCKPAITTAAEILSADGELRDTPERRVVLDLPANLDRAANPAVDTYLREGEARGIDKSYIASHRKPWWRVGVGAPAPIVASYMARQAPKFALNPDGLALLNIGHGIYPRQTMSEEQLRLLAEALNRERSGYTGKGRTYHGGLEKFEPGEMEALRIPEVL